MTNERYIELYYSIYKKVQDPEKMSLKELEQLSRELDLVLDDESASEYMAERDRENFIWQRQHLDEYKQRIISRVNNAILGEQVRIEAAKKRIKELKKLIA